MIWLERRDVEAFHDDLVAEYGGLRGLRDAGALESALARPPNVAAYGKPRLHDLAAEYAFGIARNHPFADGNKRTALVAAFVFLELNGFEVVADEADTVVMFLALAAGKLTPAEMAAWLKANSKKPGVKRK